MGINKFIAILASLSFTVSAFAQDEMGGEKKPFSIYGDLATSMAFYSNEGGNHDDFNVNLVEINLEKNWSKSKLHLSIGYGSTANMVNPSINASQATDTGGDTYISGAPSDTINLMNAYYHMNTSYGLGFWVGKFESPVGHEVYNQMDNAQFTRSYGFHLAPYFSTGLGVDYGSNDMWRVGFLVTNGLGKDTDLTDKNKTMALVVDLDPMKNLHVDLNYVTGTEGSTASQVNVLDASVDFMVNEMLDFAVNYIDYGSKPAGGSESKASSIALYGNANFGMFGLGLRYEMFNYDQAINGYNSAAMALAAAGMGVFPSSTDADNKISSITLAAKAEVDQNALVMLEYRMDSADNADTWNDKDGNNTDSFNTLTAAFMYRF